MIKELLLIIAALRLDIKSNLENLLEIYSNYFFIYDENYRYIPYAALDLIIVNREQQQSNKIPNIDNDFYEGFGIDL